MILLTGVCCVNLRELRCVSTTEWEFGQQTNYGLEENSGKRSICEKEIVGFNRKKFSYRKIKEV